MGKKLVRPTQEEQQKREDFAYALLSSSLLKSQVKALFRKRFGNLHHSTIENYLRRARARMFTVVAQGQEVLRAGSFAFYMAIVRDESAAVQERINARARIDKLLGLNVIQHQSNLNLDELSDEQLERLAGGEPLDAVVRSHGKSRFCHQQTLPAK
jgi:hypothetical protein